VGRQHYNVRLALVRNSSTPLSIVLSYLPQLTVVDLRRTRRSRASFPENLPQVSASGGEIAGCKLPNAKPEAEPQSRLRGELLFAAEGSGSLRGKK